MLECPWVHPQLGGMAGPVYSFHRCGFRRFRASAKTALSGSCRLLVSHTHSLSFFFPFFLCPSLWSIHLDVFHRVTNDSMPLAFFFIQFSLPVWRETCSLDSPVVSRALGRGAVAQCTEQHRALCAIPTIVFLFFFFFFSSFNCQSSFSHTLAMSLFLLVCEDLSDLNSFANSQWLSVFRIVGGDGKHRFTPGFSSYSPSFFIETFCLSFPFLM